MVLQPTSAQDVYRDDMLLPPRPNSRYVMVLLDQEEARLLDIQTRCGSTQQVTPCAIATGGPRFRHAWGKRGGPTVFHAALIARLRGVAAVVIVGHGHGAAEVVADLLNALREHHPGLSRRVIAAVSLPASHPTEAHLLELARTVFRQDDVAP